MNSKAFTPENAFKGLTASEAFQAFQDNSGPFANDELAKVVRHKFRHAARVVELLRKECESLKQTMTLPFIDKVLGAKPTAVINVLKHSFEVAGEGTLDIREACWQFCQNTAKLDEVDDAITAFVSNALAMGFTAGYATRGFAAMFEPTDSGHEYMATSATRIEALTDELSTALNRTSLLAVLYAMSAN